MPRMRRTGRPGLIGLAARTAVVAGTADIVSGGAARRHQATDALDAQREKIVAQEEQAQIAAAVAAAVSSSTGAAGTPVSAPDLVAGLEKLAKLHIDGVLTDSEFSAAKARLLR